MDLTQTPKWSDAYRERLTMYERLASEVEFALDTTTTAQGIKTHLVTSRVKALDSLEQKAKLKELPDPLTEVEDIVGVRVVVLFLSDLPRLDTLIRESFEIHSAEDKIASSDPASFGYMSVHYIASLGAKHLGPRYDSLKTLRFEIQTRTIVMDAWANVSHYLDYKGGSSIPEELRRDFFALSGLFYVADQHFEMLSGRSQASQDEAKREIERDDREEIDVNLDTVEAYIRERYPDRKRTERRAIAEFVNEIASLGYEDLGALSKSIEAGDPAFEKYEADLRESGDREPFWDLAAARLSLAFADRDYGEIAYASDQELLLRYGIWPKDSE